MSGKNPEEVTGAFNVATQAAEGFGKGVKKALSVATLIEFAAAAVHQFGTVEEAEHTAAGDNQVHRRAD